MLIFIVVLLLIVTAVHWLSIFVALTPFSELLVEWSCVLLSRRGECLVASVLDKVTAHLVSTLWHSWPSVTRTKHVWGSVVLLVVKEDLWLLSVLPLVLNDRLFIERWLLHELHFSVAPMVWDLWRRKHVLLDVHPCESGGRFRTIVKEGCSQRRLFLSTGRWLLQLRIRKFIRVIVYESWFKWWSFTVNSEYSWLGPIFPKRRSQRWLFLRVLGAVASVIALL